MKRISVFLIAILILLSFAGCQPKEESSTEEEIPETTEQEIIEDTVLDYSKLTVTELEVFGYEADPVAQYYLGLAYEYGKDNVNQDFSKALEWYEKSAAFDNADAYTAIGYIYLNGCGVEKDLELAAQNFEQAIMLGDVNAMVGLARVKIAEVSDEDIFANHGQLDAGVDDETEEENSPEEESKMDEAEVTEEAENSEGTEEADPVQTTYQEALDLIKEAYRADDVDATYYLGMCMEKGIACDASIAKAIPFLEKAATSTDKGITSQFAINAANVELGLIYVKGVEIDQDYKKALEYFEAAADNGYPKGQYYCGQMYENALGVDKDYEKALEYYLQAAEKDFAPALNQIGYLYYNGYGVDVDFASAVYYQKLAALQGYAIAQVNLGYLYENGYGIERNLDTALSYYELAADAGYEGALEAALRVRAQINEEE